MFDVAFYVCTPYDLFFSPTAISPFFSTVKAPTIPMLDSSSSMGFSTVKAPTIPTLDGSSSMGFSTVKAPTIPTLGSSSSMGLNNGFSLEASKSSDGQATSMDWSGYNP